jgi:hypothetical protein
VRASGLVEVGKLHISIPISYRGRARPTEGF